MKLTGAAVFYRPWTPAEIQELRTMGNLGFSQREIGAKLGRSKAAVNCMRQCLGLKIAVRPKPGPKPKNVKIEKVTPTLTVSKNDLPAFYELGWQVVSFGVEGVLLEWKNKGEPRYPAQEQRRAA